MMISDAGSQALRACARWRRHAESRRARSRVQTTTLIAGGGEAASRTRDAASGGVDIAVPHELARIGRISERSRRLHAPQMIAPRLADVARSPAPLGGGVQRRAVLVRKVPAVGGRQLR